MHCVPSREVMEYYTWCKTDIVVRSLTVGMRKNNLHMISKMFCRVHYFLQITFWRNVILSLAHSKTLSKSYESELSNYEAKSLISSFYNLAEFWKCPRPYILAHPKLCLMSAGRQLFTKDQHWYLIWGWILWNCFFHFIWRAPAMEQAATIAQSVGLSGIQDKQSFTRA